MPAAPVMSATEQIAALEKIIEEGSDAVVNLRKLDATQINVDGINREFKTPEQLGQIIKGFYRREALQKQVFDAEQLYKVLGLMDEDQDLEDILTGIQLQQNVAVFDDLSEKLYVISDVSLVGPREKVGITAAYMAGVQQQLFDTAGLLERTRPAGTDQERAVKALIGGEIAQVLTGYIETVLSADEVVELQKPLAENKLRLAPNIIQKTILFPQREGLTFVAKLHGREDRGWEAVNEAYARPPASTEQILHPEKYFENEDPQLTALPNISGLLGKGWFQASTNTLGEFLLRSYLEEHLDAPKAAEAAAGWGGDRYSLLSGPEAERLLIAMISWDSFEDSTEFFKAYELFVNIKTQGTDTTSSPAGPDAYKWIMPDQAIFLGQLGPAILLVIGDDEDLVSEGLSNLFDAMEQAP